MDEMKAAEEDMTKSICCDVTKAQAKALRVGDVVTVTIRGKVQGLHAYGGKEESYTLDVEYSGPAKIESNKADASVRGMMGDAAPAGRHKNEADKSLDDIYVGKTRSY